jgi:hypothetical protein
MKKTLTITIIFLLTAFFSFSQYKVDSISGNLSYRQIEDVDFNKTKLRNHVLKWFAKSFDNSESLISLNTEGSIVARPMISINSSVELFYSFVLAIDFKDNKYKYELSDFESVMFLPNKVKTPYISFKGITKEKYLWYLKSSLLAYSDDLPMFKIMEKALNLNKYENPKYLDEMYNKAMGMAIENEKLLKQRLNNLEDSLKAFLIKSSKDDW